MMNESGGYLLNLMIIPFFLLLNIVPILTHQLHHAYTLYFLRREYLKPQWRQLLENGGAYLKTHFQYAAAPYVSRFIAIYHHPSAPSA